MWLIGLALAQQADCLTCCEDAGTACEAILRVVAEDHQITDAGVNGTWVVSCDGSAVFDPVGVFPVPGAIAGEVVTEGLPPSQLRCFAENCAFPEDLCPEAHEGRPVLKHCDTDAPFVDLDLAPAPAVVVQRGTAPRVQPGQAPTVSFKGDAVPEPPERSCSATGELRRTSRELVTEGNDLEIAGDLNQARNRYLAAISVYPCTTLGWTSLGLLAERQGDYEGAVRALLYAVAEQPQHYGAWTALGQAYEAAGETDQAIAAYERALQLRPGHAAAQQGLARLR